MRATRDFDKYRVRTGRMATTTDDEGNGYFLVPSLRTGVTLVVIASDGFGCIRDYRGNPGSTSPFLSQTIVPIGRN